MRLERRDFGTILFAAALVTGYLAACNQEGDNGENGGSSLDGGGEGGRADGGSLDGSRLDGSNPDGGRPDASNPDASNPDASNPDASNPDASNPDANRLDGSNPDSSYRGDADAALPSDSGPMDVSAGEAMPADSGMLQEAATDAATTPVSPTGVAVDSAGYVFLSATNGVFAYSPVPSLQLVQGVTPVIVGNAAAADAAAAPLQSPNIPQGLALDGAGHLLVANFYETANMPGCFFSPPGTFGSDIASYIDEVGMTTPSLPFSSILIGNPTATTLDCATGVTAAAGDIFVATTDYVFAFTGSGAEIARSGYPAFANPFGIAVDAAGTHVYVADGNNGAVYVYLLSSGALTQQTSSTISVNGGSSEPQFVAVDSSDNVYVADKLSNSIHIYSSAGAQTGQITAVTGAMAFDSTGRLYILTGGRVVIYSNTSGTWQPTSFSIP